MKMIGAVVEKIDKINIARDLKNGTCRKIQTLYLQQKHHIITTPIMLDIILKSTSMYFLKYCT